MLIELSARNINADYQRGLPAYRQCRHRRTPGFLLAAISPCDLYKWIRTNGSSVRVP